jgi:hypothetical protein
MIEEKTIYQELIEFLRDLYKRDINDKTEHKLFEYKETIDNLDVLFVYPGHKHNFVLIPDFYVKFKIKIKNKWVAPSHGDIVRDIYQKCSAHPELIPEFMDFVFHIGIEGYNWPVPESLLQIKEGIPIQYYPVVLCLVSLNEEVCYNPKVKSWCEGRRTCYKKYMEAIFMAETKGDINLVIKRTHEGKCKNLLKSFSSKYLYTFKNIDSEYKH